MRPARFVVDPRLLASHLPGLAIQGSAATNASCPRSACGNATCGMFQHFRIAPRNSTLAKLQLNRLLLHQNLTIFIVSRLPDSNDRPIRLNLIDISAIDPDALGDISRRGDDRGCNHRGGDNWRMNDHRCGTDYCIGYDSADYAANESRPEITSSASPSTAMMSMVMTRGRGRRAMAEAATVMHRRTRTTETTRSAMRTRQANATAHNCRESHNHRHFLVHFTPCLSPLHRGYI